MIMTNWISVKDKLPNKDGRYLVCIEYSPEWMGVSSFRKGKWDDTNVSHWMELPDSPNNH